MRRNWGLALIFFAILVVSSSVPLSPTKKSEPALCGYQDRGELPTVNVTYELFDSSEGSVSKRQSTGWPSGWGTIRIYVDVGRLDPTKRLDSRSCYPDSTTFVNDLGQTQQCADNLRITTKVQSTLVNDLIPKAVAILRRSLAVRPLTSLSFQSGGGGNPGAGMCGVNLNASSPTFCDFSSCNFTGYDLVIIATARPILQDGVLARAGACGVEQTGRAIAGEINFNPPTVNNDKYGAPQSLGTAVHEIGHILGFNFDSFSRFWNPTTNQRIPFNQVVKSTQFPTPAGTTRQIYKVITPNVIQEVRDHFGCNTIDGLELENYPLVGTNGSHWELRTTGNEFMVGLSQTHPIFSRLTLALFLDSGWYQVNMSAASHLEYGYKKGCDFVQKNCNSWTRELYWCDSASATSCNYDRTAKSSCYLVNYPSAIDPQYRFYSDPTLGGDQYADYCSYYVPINFGQGPVGDCTNTSNGVTSGGILGTRAERWGPNSRCFDNTLLLGNTGVADRQQGCYGSLCVSGVLKIRIGQYWYDCPIGGSISPTGYGGSLTCPTDNSLCGPNSDLDPGVVSAFAAAIGAYGPTQTIWPKIYSIEPTSGGPGTEITINGTNFLKNMTGMILQPSVCTFISSTTYKCTVADQSTFDQLKNIKVSAVDVILYSPDTQQSAILQSGFVLDADLGNIFNIAGRWMKRNPGPTAGIFAGAAILFGIAIYFCVRESRKTRRGRNPNVNV